MLSLPRLLVGGEFSARGQQHRRTAVRGSRTGLVTDAIAIALLALATIVIGALLARRVVGLGSGELRTLSS